MSAAAHFAAEESKEPEHWLPEPKVRKAAWRPQLVNGIRITDAMAVTVAVFAGQFGRFGFRTHPIVAPVDSEFTYTALSILLILSWLSLLSMLRTRTPWIVGSGPEEYRRVIDSTLRLFGGIAIVALVFQLNIARGYLAIALPLGLVLLLFSRWLWRQRLVAKRRAGASLSPVVVIGNPDAVREFAVRFSGSPSDGLQVVGACVPGYAGRRGKVIHGGNRMIPIYGDERSILEAIEHFGADTVAVTATEQLGSRGIKELIWTLEPYDIELLVTPGVSDVAGSRMMLHPGNDVNLIHISKPTYSGAQRVAKTTFDLLFATMALIAVAPVMLIIALCIKLSSRGPVFYAAERVGLNGKPFSMLKFRSMVVDADARREELEHQNEAGGPLFKIREDPRVTGVGKIIRRYSLDELPQFINVLKRDMSIVGPRPPMANEVSTYDGAVHRRLLVRPGLTGLWQVSGRSDLSWDESVRLDLYYVENWSLVTDCLLVLKTIRAVVRPNGAY
ncbi:sugar transferase [Smaragdicoccus niigatensis]|uniref:sugar transferase n=1 Tax=Smaragdicoccus niigatensis TaxID=359359 RepID=UPI00036089A3|nr:sugar transferase [Smaragdicoccus niigatensis]